MTKTTVSCEIEVFFGGLGVGWYWTKAPHNDCEPRGPFPQAWQAIEDAEKAVKSGNW